MKKKINIEYAWLTSFVEQVADARYFEKEGCMIHSGRNILKIFSIDGVSVVVKRYGRITLINRVLYALLRKSKAQRAYENSFILRRLGIDTPEVVAYVECRSGLVMTSCSLVTLYSDWQPLSSLHAYRYGDSDKEEHFYILRHTKCPAVLTENLFMDTERDCRFLMSEEGRERIANFHFKAIKRIVDTYGKG